VNDLPPPSLETRGLFAHERVARGYASARPFLHPEVFARVRELEPLFAGKARKVAFGGYIQVLRRL
jgi:hypothetical protein